MKPRSSTLLLLAACTCAPACGAPSAAAPAPGSAQAMIITSAHERGWIAGGDEHFTGQATISMLFLPNGPRDFSGAYVTFQPGARTAWHSHPAGQTLVVTEGSGWVQIEGEQRRDLNPGDVVWTPPGVRHWHGATASSAMTHMALQGDVDGTAVNWFEQVSDAQYSGPIARQPRPGSGRVRRPRDRPLSFLVIPARLESATYGLGIHSGVTESLSNQEVSSG